MSGAGKTRGRMQLTDKAIRPDPQPYRWSDTRAAGLALRVASDGAKTWDCAYRIRGSGKVTRTALGRYENSGLEEARTRAGELTGAARNGVDLIAQEREAREAAARQMSVDKLLELYLARRVRRRLRSALEVERILKRVLKPLAGLFAVEVKRRDLSPLLEAIAAAGHERAAGNARQLISGMFAWAETQDIVSINPARGVPRYDPGRARDRVLDAEEIRAVWPWLESLPNSVCDALRVQLFVGARIGEVVGMTGGEVDRGKWLWTLPASRSKNGKKRVTPLVGQARAIVEARLNEADDGLLFFGERGGTLTSAGIATALFTRRKRMPIPAFTSHDLRRTAVTTMLELGGSRDVIGAIIGHEGDGDRAARTLIKHYVKTDLIARKKHALETWDAQLKAIIANELADNVVHLPRGA